MTSRRARHVSYTDAGIPIMAIEESINCLGGASLLDHYSARHVGFTAAGIPIHAIAFKCCDEVNDCPKVENSCLEGGISQRILLYSYEVQNCLAAASQQFYLYYCEQLWQPTLASDDASAGSVAWGSADNALDSDDAYATATLSGNESHYLVLSGAACGFPDGYPIYNIAARIEAKATGTVSDVEIRLVVGGVITGNNMATSTALTGTDSILEVSDTPTNWGVPTLSAADVQGDGFGIAIRYSGTGTVSVDAVEMTLSICPIPAGSGTDPICDQCDDYYPARSKWVGSLALRTGTLNFEMCCSPPTDPFDPLTAKFFLSWSGCEHNCSVWTFPTCYDPLTISFGNLTLNDCCGCGDTTEQGQINLQAVANCRPFVWGRHVDYTTGGIPVMATENCGLVEPSCGCQPTCEWTATIIGEVGTGTGSSTDCSCLAGSYSLPYVGASTWENINAGACSEIATIRVECTNNNDGTVDLLLNVICGAQNIGYATKTVNCTSMDTIDETFDIHMIGPEATSCGTCTFQWNEMAMSWSNISSNCTGGCTCVDELTIPPGSVDGEQVTLDCLGGGVSICCDGWISVRLQRA